MKLKTFFAALLFLVAGMQTAWGQGFRVYKSDGTVAQFSLRTDSIVFYDGIGTDEDFGPFTPVNQPIVGTWYKTKSKTVTFNEDGTTDYMEGATYKFFPYQGNVVFYNASGAPMSVLKVYELTAEQMIVDTGDHLSVWSRTQPVQLVEFIMLSETSITLQPDETMRLTATVEPADADNPEVTWTSSDDAVATVINNGLVVAVADGTCIITCSATDGSGVKAECQVTVGATDTHEWVDLGLPSGTLWATCNVGANSPEEYGDYFAWGETQPKSEYYWSTYFDTDDNGDTFKKYYNNGGLTELLPEDDAATANWGSNWRMPSLAQIKELYSEYTTREWTQQNGVNGRRITSKSNGNSIFLPAAGFRLDSSLYLAGGSGNYWSRSLSTSGSCDAYYLFFYSGDIGWVNGSRYYGRSVRPVRVLE